jgi:hypothetical protein
VDKKERTELSEIDACDLFISPAIREVGWDPVKRIRREVTLAPGPVIVRGNRSSHNKKKRGFADYVLAWEPGIPVVDASFRWVRRGLAHLLPPTRLITADGLTDPDSRRPVPSNPYDGLGNASSAEQVS